MLYSRCLGWCILIKLSQLMRVLRSAWRTHYPPVRLLSRYHVHLERRNEYSSLRGNLFSRIDRAKRIPVFAKWSFLGRRIIADVFFTDGSSLNPVARSRAVSSFSRASFCIRDNNFGKIQNCLEMFVKDCFRNFKNLGIINCTSWAVLLLSVILFWP